MLAKHAMHGSWLRVSASLSPLKSVRGSFFILPIDCRCWRWLVNHPRWVFHFTPTSASWLNAVESFFSAVTRRRIRRGVFRSVAELEDAIRRYILDHNRHPQPFVWTKTADQIFQKLRPLAAPSE